MKTKVIYILLILLAIVTTCNIYVTMKIKQQNKKYRLEPKSYTRVYLPLEQVNCPYNKIQIKNQLDNYYNISYEYIETDFLGEEIRGRVSNNTIFVLKDLRPEEYVIVLAHEINHIKYPLGNETFVHYYTLISLYEMDTQLYRVIAANEIKMILSGSIYENSPLDCGYYLLKYFEGRLNTL